MIATDNFSQFSRRMAATQGFPHVVIAETPNPLRQLDADALRVRAEAMIEAIVEGLTLPAAEIERRSKQSVIKQSGASRLVRSSVAV